MSKPSLHQRHRSADADAFYVYPATSGLYALQADGPSFQEVIVISAT